MNYMVKAYLGSKLNSIEVVTISNHSSIIKLRYKLMGWLNKVFKKLTKLVFKNNKKKKKNKVLYFTVNFFYNMI
jgi:hypothetical protein